MDGSGRLEAGTLRYTMNLTYLVDDSGSMSINGRIDQLNVAMSNALDAAEKAARNFEADLRIRVIKIGTVSNFILNTSPKDGLDHIDWVALGANSGGTDTAGALTLTRDIMHTENLGSRNLKPVVILITDGESNDPVSTQRAVDDLKNSLVGSNPEITKDKIIRIAIGVQGANKSELEYFASKGTIIDEDGDEKKDVPLVFDVNNVDILSSLLQNVTVSSIASACKAGGVDGDDDDDDDDDTIIDFSDESEGTQNPVVDDDDGWENN